MLESVAVVPASRIPDLLPMDTCIDEVERSFRQVARGEANQPLRTVIRLLGGENSFMVKPASTADPPTVGAKLLTLFPGNRSRDLPTHQGILVLFDPGTGALSALMDAEPITAIRTAAASAVATRALARPDAGDLALLGSGVQARTHLEAMACVRTLRRVRVWSPTRENRERFAREESGRAGVPVESVETAQEAVEGADLICTVTGAREPVLEGDWLSEGVHVNAVGASAPETRELDGEAVLRSRLYVDRMESALAEAGDILIPLTDGIIDRSHLEGEIGELLEGTIDGRSSPHEVTLFKSLGLAVQDLAAARVILERMERREDG